MSKFDDFMEPLERWGKSPRGRAVEKVLEVITGTMLLVCMAWLLGVPGLDGLVHQIGLMVDPVDTVMYWPEDTSTPASTPLPDWVCPPQGEGWYYFEVTPGNYTFESSAGISEVWLQETGVTQKVGDNEVTVNVTSFVTLVGVYGTNVTPKIDGETPMRCFFKK